MKHVRNILIIILAFAVSVIFLVVMWNTQWKPLAEMTELGYLELEPVAKATKPITLSDGHESTEYYVVLDVETVDGAKELYILMSEAYDEKDLLTNLENYRKKKKVEGYYFYSESAGEVYFSKDLSTAREYMESKAKMIVDIVLLLNVFLIVIIALTTVLGRVSLPELPGGDWPREQMVVCRYSNFTYGMIAVLCLAMGGMMMWSVYSFCVNAEGSQDYLCASMFLLLGLAFIGLGITFILFMKNYVVVFFPGGIVYRNLIGRTWQYKDEQIEHVSVIRAYRNHSIRIKTEDKNIWLNYYCTNFHQAEEAVGKYPCK